MNIILGSQSPRRKEILEYFSLPFTQIASDYDEDNVIFHGDPKAYAIELSQKKAEVLSEKHLNSIIITADTVVYFQGRIFNKPKSSEEAFQMLSELSNQWHQVYTAVTVQHNGTPFSGIEETKILFHPLTHKQIRLYHENCSFLDKAGAYAIQQAGNIIVKHIDGCYYNVMGLPINILKELLSKVGIDLWEFLKPC
ncbi:MAG: Maf family nucleotide pyrophosphatase [Rhabdochlamydiaceae bacterium]|nr:Maf family nucleotide pyrophosphatase [Rhabdochlamydiaceae bacterium]